MPWSEAVAPVTMRRIALVAPRDRLRDALVRAADAGVLELDRVIVAGEGPVGDAARRLQRTASGSVRPLLLATPPDLDLLEQTGRADLLAGEAELEERAADAVPRGSVAALVGWAPVAQLPGLAARLAEVGAAVAPLPRPRGAEPPTLLRAEGVGRSFTPVVETYSTVPYEDVDPTVFAALAYVAMFGVMFGDAGHGLLLVLLGLLLRSGRWGRLAGLRRGWAFVVGAGMVATMVGVAYGEFFGPTGVLPVRWVDPLEEPVLLLTVAVAAGAVLLAGAYALGTLNRAREGGWRYALYAPAGLAGATLFLGLGLVAMGAFRDWGWLLLAGALVAAAGLVLSFVGLRAAAGPGPAGWLQASVELFDVVVRLGANLVSFARLAAFGLTHAALGMVVWDGTVALWDRGGAGVPAAVLVFLVGNALTFGLEALVAGVQALRLEYYELFSRVFQGEGRPFRPWHLPVVPGDGSEEAAR
jgi:V/A-type H+-transporting ATPase subunit I